MRFDFQKMFTGVQVYQRFYIKDPNLDAFFGKPLVTDFSWQCQQMWVNLNRKVSFHTWHAGDRLVY